MWARAERADLDGEERVLHLAAKSLVAALKRLVDEVVRLLDPAEARRSEGVRGDLPVHAVLAHHLLEHQKLVRLLKNLIQCFAL